VSLRFIADADLNYAIVAGTRRREPGIDFLSANEGLVGLRDPEVLLFAAEQARILVSDDASTMPVHFQRFLAEGRTSPGVFLVSQEAAIREVIEALVLVWSASSPCDWADRIHRLPSLAPYTFKAQT
jgi:hypothetical protein